MKAAQVIKLTAVAVIVWLAILVIHLARSISSTDAALSEINDRNVIITREFQSMVDRLVADEEQLAAEENHLTELPPALDRPLNGDAAPATGPAV